MRILVLLLILASCSQKEPEIRYVPQPAQQVEQLPPGVDSTSPLYWFADMKTDTIKAAIELLEGEKRRGYIIVKYLPGRLNPSFKQPIQEIFVDQNYKPLDTTLKVWDIKKIEW